MVVQMCHLCLRIHTIERVTVVLSSYDGALQSCGQQIHLVGSWACLGWTPFIFVFKQSVPVLRADWCRSINSDAICDSIFINSQDVVL